MSTKLLWKVAKFAVPFIVGLIVGGLIVGKAKQVQMDAVKVELTKTRQELATCQDANATSQATIGSMKAELQSAQANCTARLRQKERTAAEITRIDNLKPGVKADETKGNTGNGGAGDPILDALNGMYVNDRRPADRED